MRAFSRRFNPLYGGLDRYAGWMLFGIAILAFALRVWGLEAGLPYVYHPDEPHYVQIAQDILKHGDLNPHFFNYPSLFFYLNTLLYLPFFVVGNMLGILPTLNAIPTPSVEVLGVGYTSMNATFLVGRYLTVAFGVGSVLLAYAVGTKLLKSKVVGLLSALFLAFSTTNVNHSRFITPDTQVTFFVLLSFLGCVLVYERGKTKHYVLAGVAVGLAISSKYNGALILVALVAAHLLGEGWLRALRDRRIYLALLMAAVSFLATTPYALFDAPQFFSGLGAEFMHYSLGHAGSEGDSLTWYLEYLWSYEGVVALLAVVEAARALTIRYAHGVLLSIFPLTYFVFINLFTVRNDRTLLPMLPFLFLLAASFLTRLLETRPAIQPVLLPGGRLLMQKSTGSSASAGMALAVVSALFLLAQMANSTNLSLASVSKRDQVRLWINKHIPSGSILAVESYAIYLDPQRYTVEGFSRLINNGPDWYKAQGFQYLVFSGGMFGRYYKERVRYAEEVAQYDDLFRSFSIVQTFPDERNEIRVYRVDAGSEANLP